MSHPKPCRILGQSKKKQKNIVEQQYKMRETIHRLFYNELYNKLYYNW